ncbi:hypothetical protein NHQ30_003366 [Ciborinia camelliae]|nr:hypothetical protein NHQ30_003366 [Ciborinia camelliae]
MQLGQSRSTAPLRNPANIGELQSSNPELEKNVQKSEQDSDSNISSIEPIPNPPRAIATPRTNRRNESPRVMIEIEDSDGSLHEPLGHNKRPSDSANLLGFGFPWIFDASLANSVA